MEKTGVVFEMTETFTLENMFAMELHRHTDVLNEIVTAAVKEVAIEKVGARPGKVPRAADPVPRASRPPTSPWGGPCFFQKRRHAVSPEGFAGLRDKEFVPKRGRQP